MAQIVLIGNVHRGREIKVKLYNSLQKLRFIGNIWNDSLVLYKNQELCMEVLQPKIIIRFCC